MGVDLDGDAVLRAGLQDALPPLPVWVSRRWWCGWGTFFTGLRQLLPGCSPSLPFMRSYSAPARIESS